MTAAETLCVTQGSQFTGQAMPTGHLGRCGVVQEAGGLWFCGRTGLGRMSSWTGLVLAKESHVMVSEVQGWPDVSAH